MTPRRLDPRTARTRDIVLSATKDQLVEEGFERVSIDAIATQCGVARSTIYRNWTNRAQLLIEAFEELLEQPEIVDEPLEDALRRQARFLVDGLTISRWGRVIPSLIGAAAHDEELGNALRDFSDRRRRGLTALVDIAVARGELTERSYKRAPLASQRFAAAFFFAVLVTREPISEDFVESQIQLTLKEFGRQD